MKIADYGKAITSYIESPTKAQKDKLKLQAGLLEEYLGDDLEYQRAVDDGFQGTKEDYYRYKSTSEEDRTFLSEGTPPPKKPRQLKDLYERINRAVLAVSSRTVPPELIVPQLETLTQEYIKDGLISGEDARKFAVERKDYWDKWISENPGGTTPTFDFDNEGKATEVDQEEIIRRINEADGGRVERAIGGGVIEGEDLGTREGFEDPNVTKRRESINSFINKFNEQVLNEMAQNKYGKNFSELEGDNLKNFKKRLLKFEDFIKQNNRMPTEDEARKLGRADRDKTIFETGAKEVTEEDVRNKLIKNNKPAETFKGKIIFADPDIQAEFEAELKKRYSLPRTSAKAEAAGVLNNLQIYKKFLEPAGYSMSSARTIIDDYKKSLDLQFKELLPEEKEAKKIERETEQKIGGQKKRISGTVENPVHHMFPLGDQVGSKVEEFTVIPKKINSQIAFANKQMKKLIKERRTLLDKVRIDQSVNIENLDKQLADINNRAEEVIKAHYKKFPSHEGLLNWKKIDFVLDDVGRLLNVRQVGTIGGDYKKWTLANIDKTILDKDVAKLSKEELAEFRKVINETTAARDSGNKVFGGKDTSAIKNLFANLKTKLDTSRMFTSKIPGGAIALTPLDFMLSYGSGMPLIESAASAGSYLLKDPYIGKAVNLPLAILQDTKDPEELLKTGIERGQKAEAFLQGLLSDFKDNTKDKPNLIDDFEEVGKSTFGKYNDQIKNIKLP